MKNTVLNEQKRMLSNILLTIRQILKHFVHNQLDELRSSGNVRDMETHDNIVSTIANFSLQIVAGISKVCAEHDNRNSSADQLPPVLPLDLCSVHSRDFTSCLQQQMIRIKQKFSDAEVEKIDDQFRNLRLAFKEQSGFSQMLQTAQACSTVQSFEQCWSPLGSELKTCKGFVGPLQASCQGPAALNQISPSSIGQRIPVHKA